MKHTITLFGLLFILAGHCCAQVQTPREKQIKKSYQSMTQSKDGEQFYSEKKHLVLENLWNGEFPVETRSYSDAGNWVIKYTFDSLNRYTSTCYFLGYKKWCKLKPESTYVWIDTLIYNGYQCIYLIRRNQDDGLDTIRYTHDKEERIVAGKSRTDKVTYTWREGDLISSTIVAYNDARSTFDTIITHYTYDSLTSSDYRQNPHLQSIDNLLPQHQLVREEQTTRRSDGSTDIAAIDFNYAFDKKGRMKEEVRTMTKEEFRADEPDYHVQFLVVQHVWHKY